MLYIGLDIHDKRIAICVLGESGQIAHRVQVRTIDEMMRFLEALSRQTERIELHLNQRAKYSPAVLLLRSIPGVGVRTAEAVTAFIDDPDRFRGAKAIGRYFGLVPSQDQSGDRNRLGHITREGPAVVRQLVAEATWQAVRRSPTVRAYF